MSKSYILLFFIAALIFQDSISAQENIKTLGVLNLESTNLSKVKVSDVRALTNRLHTELAKLGRFNLVEMQKVEDILREQGLQQSGACANDQCVAEVGSLLGVELMLAGYIGYIGTTFSIDVRLIDVKTRKIVQTASDNYRGKSEGLLDVMKAMASKLSYPSNNQASTGAIRITSQPGGAILLLNDDKKGITPLTINDLAPGDYKIQGKMDGYLHQPVTIQVNAGRIEQVDLKFMKLLNFKIESTPSGARFLLNGREIGRTPLARTILSGTYQTQILLPGYVPWKEEIVVNTDYEKKIELTKMGLNTTKSSDKKTKKKWPWLIAGFCIAGGGAAAAILLKDDKEETGTLRITVPQNP